MVTNIDNSERVFQVVNTNNYAQIFCNLNSLNEIINERLDEGCFIIYEFWNNKRRKVSKKALSEMFNAAGIEQEFNH